MRLAKSSTTRVSSSQTHLDSRDHASLQQDCSNISTLMMIPREYTIDQTICTAYRLRIRHLALHVVVPPSRRKEFARDIIPALMTDFGTDHPLKTLKLVCDQRHLRLLAGKHNGYRPEEDFQKLRELPATTKLELVDFPRASEAIIRALIGRQTG